MLISMQGNWTVSVKSKSAAFPQQFTISGSDGSDGTYSGHVGIPSVDVSGSQWTIAISNNPGTGFQLSDARIKFPVLINGYYSFDIESNDAGNDEDFNDLILTCSSYANFNDYLIYGHASSYSGNCIWNPCWRNWFVIDTAAALEKALLVPQLKDVITKLYPERVSLIKVNPNPPDPGPDFIPLMINVLDDVQIPARIADVYKKQSSTVNERASADTKATETLAFNRSVAMPQASGIATLDYNRYELAKLYQYPFYCSTQAVPGLTLAFEEYDRSVPELAGGPYTGLGNRQSLGNAITDMNGNYIFRFSQTFGDILTEYFSDTAVGEVASTKPDIIVKVKGNFPAYTTLFETGCYFNIDRLKRIDLCLPASVIPHGSTCFNGSLIGELGNVFVGGNENSTASLSAAALNRDGYNNHLRSDGKVTVHSSQALFSVDCASWAGTIDVRGCMYNKARAAGDPIIKYYTLRYSSDGINWLFYDRTYKHPRYSNRNLPNYDGDIVGPIAAPPLDVNNNGIFITAPTYLNIQADLNVNLVDWEEADITRYIQLDTNVLQAGGIPRTVYFWVEGYDEDGNRIAQDLIPLFVNNTPIKFGLSAPLFTSTIELLGCSVYKMADTEMNTPVQFSFNATDDAGFINEYTLSYSKCPSKMDFTVIAPASLPGINIPLNTLAHGTKAANTDTNPLPVGPCSGYRGVSEDFLTNAPVQVTLSPDGGWLQATEEVAVINFGLTATRRITNGYNTGIDGTYQANSSLTIIRK